MEATRTTETGRPKEGRRPGSIPMTITTTMRTREGDKFLLTTPVPGELLPNVRLALGVAGTTSVPEEEDPSRVSGEIDLPKDLPIKITVPVVVLEADRLSANGMIVPREVLRDMTIDPADRFRPRVSTPEHSPLNWEIL